MILSELSFPIPSRLVFEETIARDWYDGITSGFAMSLRHGAAFRFDIVAWGPKQETRVFVFSPLDGPGLREIVGLLSRSEAPHWPVWFPKWGMSEPDSSSLRDEIDRILLKSRPPEFAVASDSMFETLFAAKPLDQRTRGWLPSQFDGFLSRDNFDEWKEFLALPT